MQNWDGLKYTRDGNVVSFFDENDVCVMVMSKASFIAAGGAVSNPARGLLKKAAHIAALASLCSCARELPLVIDVHDQPQWVVDSMSKAADFWALQDVNIVLDDTEGNEGVPVEIVQPKDIDFALATWSPIDQKFRVAEGLDNIDPRAAALPTCVLAHEIGHAIGLGHVEDQASLMYKTAGLPIGGQGCWWSADDQIELCRATGCGSEGEVE